MTHLASNQTHKLILLTALIQFLIKMYRNYNGACHARTTSQLFSNKTINYFPDLITKLS